MPRKTTPPLLSHSRTSEKAIEHYFCAQMRLLGLPCIKQFNPYEAGWPDRLVVLPLGCCVWVEFKSTGEKPTTLQQLRHEVLNKLGHKVYIVSSRQEAENLVSQIKKFYTSLLSSIEATVPDAFPSGNTPQPEIV